MTNHPLQFKGYTADVTHPEDVLKQAHKAEIERYKKHLKETNEMYISQMAALRGELDITVDMMQDKDAEIDTLYRLLESLTPGGSEFHNNPQACVDFAKDRIKTTVKLAKERNALREELRIANETADALAEANAAKIEMINEQNREIVLLRRNFAKAQEMINDYSLELGKTHKDIRDLLQLADDLTAELKAKIDDTITK